MTEAQKATRREANRKWRLAHPDKVKAANLKWRTSHPEKVREMNKRWRTKVSLSHVAAPVAVEQPAALEAVEA